jgi:hypothetical protein
MKRVIISLLILQSSLVTTGGDNDKWFIGSEGAKAAKKVINDAFQKAPSVAGDAGAEFGKKAVESAKEELKKTANTNKEYIWAIGAGLLATPFAKFVIIASAGILGVGATVKVTQDYKVRGFKRCINKHFEDDINGRGFPKACEEQEKLCQWWDEERTANTIDNFRIQKRLAQKIATN